MKLNRLMGWVVWSVAAPVVAAQTAGTTPRTDLDKIPSYALVSIHKTGNATAQAAENETEDGLTVTASTLQSLIGEAYGFSLGLVSDDELLGAPGWAKTQKFDIRAKVDNEDVATIAAMKKAETMLVEAGLMVHRTPTYRMVMLQRLLEDRFHLKMHYEQRVMSLYSMTVAKGGVKMKVAHAANPEEGSMSMSAGKLSGENVPMEFIPMVFALALERHVENKTGVEGNYDFELHYAPMGQTASSATDESAPSIFTAVQEQMGLKLQPGKGPVWVIVVDHAEMPTEN